MQRTAPCCNTLQHSSSLAKVPQALCNTLQRTLTHWNTLEHAGTCCNIRGPLQSPGSVHHDQTLNLNAPCLTWGIKLALFLCKLTKNLGRGKRDLYLHKRALHLFTMSQLSTKEPSISAKSLRAIYVRKRAPSLRQRPINVST